MEGVRSQTVACRKHRRPGGLPGAAACLSRRLRRLLQLETRAGGGAGRERDTRGRAGAESLAFASAPGRRPGPAPRGPPSPGVPAAHGGGGAPAAGADGPSAGLGGARSGAPRASPYIIDAIFNPYYDSCQSWSLAMDL